MQFLVTGLDGTDAQAMDRRMATREAHLTRIGELADAGHVLYGVALLDDDDRMVGSVLIADFPDRAGLDAWLQTEPYVVRDVWQTVDVKPCRVGPIFTHLHDKQTAA